MRRTLLPLMICVVDKTWRNNPKSKYYEIDVSKHFKVFPIPVYNSNIFRIIYFDAWSVWLFWSQLLRSFHTKSIPFHPEKKVNFFPMLCSCKYLFLEHRRREEAVGSPVAPYLPSNYVQILSLWIGARIRVRSAHYNRQLVEFQWRLKVYLILQEWH